MDALLDADEPADLITSEVSCASRGVRMSTRFDFLQQADGAAAVEVDADGDMSLARRNTGEAERHAGPPNCPADISLCILHHRQSQLEGVGLQVWRGGLLLSELMLSMLDSLRGVTALELGAGPGLPSIMLSRVARRIFLTDIGSEVLEQCQVNVQANCSEGTLFPQPALVRELDWENYHQVTQQGKAASPLHGSQTAEQLSQPDDTNQNPGRSVGHFADLFSWTPQDLADLRHLQVILAADVIYDNDLTEAFVYCAEELMRPAPGKPSAVLYLAAEKRINFTLRDMRAASHAIEYLLSLIEHPEGKVDHAEGLMQHHNLRGTRIAIDSVRQCVRYDRGPDLELWKIVWNHPS